MIDSYLMLSILPDEWFEQPDHQYPIYMNIRISRRAIARSTELLLSHVETASNASLFSSRGVIARLRLEAMDGTTGCRVWFLAVTDRVSVVFSHSPLDSYHVTACTGEGTVEMRWLKKNTPLVFPLATHRVALYHLTRPNQTYLIVSTGYNGHGPFHKLTQSLVDPLITASA